MDSIPTYLRNRREPDKISYRTPELAHILDVTNGCIVYQEQVMQICRELAGFSFGQADNVRRAMSKKKHKVMERNAPTLCTDAPSRARNAPAASTMVFRKPLPTPSMMT